MNKTTPNRFPHPNIFVYYCLSRNSELEIVPVMIIIGDKEVESKTGAVRIR